MAEQSLVQLPLPSTLPPLATQSKRSSNRPVRKALGSAANLTNLLPTGTVLAFEALMPSFSFDGSCQPTNQYLTACLISFCAITCFLSSFTDSFIGYTDGKLYYGISTFNGLYIFNKDYYEEEEEQISIEELKKYQIRVIDFVHAFLSAFVFLVFALSNSDVQSCFFPNARANQKALIMNLPLGAGVLSSFLFSIFPTSRRGIGYADMAPQANCPPKGYPAREKL